MSRMLHVGLDVHAETIAVAVAESDGTVRELGTIMHRPEAVRKLVGKLGGPAGLRVRMMAQGKSSLFIATTIGRELLGFMWALGQEIESREIQEAAIAS